MCLAAFYPAHELSTEQNLPMHNVYIDIYTIIPEELEELRILVSISAVREWFIRKEKNINTVLLLALFEVKYNGEGVHNFF